MQLQSGGALNPPHGLVSQPMIVDVPIAFFDRLGRHEPAATIAGFAAVNPLAALVFPDMTTAIAHLHESLGGPIYESLARDGESMTTTEMATYAYGQIDQARTALNTYGRAVDR